MKNVTKLLLGCSMLITPISLMTTLASCTNTPINENSVPKNIINGSLVDNGLVSHSGTLTTPFDVNFTNGTPKQDKNVVWTVVKDTAYPDEDISSFSAISHDHYGANVQWEKTVSVGAHHFCLNMNDLTDNITFTSDPILVTIINTPPPEPPTHITVKNNPENINFTTPSTNPITDFKYTLDTTNNTLTLDGFTNAVTVTDDELVLKPASTYTIESVAYTVTAINKDAFTPSNIPVSYKKMIISFPETMKTLGESCFWSNHQGTTQQPNDKVLYIDMSKCSEITNVFKGQTYGTDSIDCFAFAVIGAFVPPIHNEVLHCMWDDMFEGSYFKCDLDYRSFTKLDNLGHWAMCVCLNNESLDPTGQDANKAVGKFLIPSTVKTVGVAGTTFADINELYWDTDNIKNIKFDDSSVYLITNVFFPHFMSCYVKKLFIRNSSQFGKGWQDKINSGKEFDKQWYYHLVKTTVGPYFGIAKCEQVLEYPTPA